MAYFDSAQLQSAGYVSGQPSDFIAAPTNPGLGFSITDVLGGVGSAVGKIFGGGGGGGGNSDQIAMLIAQQQQQAQAAQKQMLMFGLGGLAIIALVLTLGARGGRRK